jgi:TolA-binding protein
MRPFLILAALLGAGCGHPHSRNATPVRTPRDTARASATARDTALESRAARLELKVLEQGAQVDELQTRLDDARREVVRAMAKLQSLATRAEAASGIAEAEIALQTLRTGTGSGGGGSTAPAPELSQGSQLLQLAAAEFDKQNYGGALYLATEAKNAAAAGQGRLSSDDQVNSRRGEVPFALPLRLQTTGRANVREGPGSNFRVSYTLDVGADLTAYSYIDQWVRVTDGTNRPGWVHQGLIGRRPDR